MIRYAHGHRGSRVFLTAVAAVALATVLSALALSHGTLQLSPLPAANVGLEWSDLAATPAAMQAYGLDTLSGVLAMLAVAAAAVCAFTLLTLSVARASALRPELIVHRAVGASRRHLVLAAVLEGGLIACAAVGLGAACGVVVIRGALAIWPGTAGHLTLLAPILVILLVSGVTVAGAMLPTLGMGRMPAPAASSRIPPSLTVAALQLSISFAVLLGAAQVGSRARLIAGHVRTASGGGEVLRLDTSGTPAERAGRMKDLLRQTEVSGLLEVTSITSPGALAGLGTVDVAITDCGRCTLGGIATPQRPVGVTVSVVSPDTFQAMNVSVIEGRAIALTDDWTARRSVVVNHALASAHFQDGRAVGRRIQLGRGANNWFHVVGVVQDAPSVALGGALQPIYAVYASALQLPPSTAEVLLRPRTGAAIPDGWIGATLSATGRVSRRTAEASWWSETAAPLRWFAGALWGGGALVLLLAVFGTGVATHLWVAALTPELALRRAVGARRREVFVYVLWRAGLVGIAGIGMGFVVGDLTSAPLSALFPGLTGVDAVTASRLALILVGAALTGALIPAWRVARRDPAALAGQLAG